MKGDWENAMKKFFHEIQTWMYKIERGSVGVKVFLITFFGYLLFVWDTKKKL